MSGLEPEQLNRVDEKGLRFAFLPNISGVGARLRNLSTAKHRLRHLIASTDAVIVRMPTALGLEAAKLSLELDKPVAVDLGGCALDDFRSHGSLKGKLYAPMAYRKLRSVVKQMNWVSYVTQSFLQQRYPAAKGARCVACSNVELPEVKTDVLERRHRRIAGRSLPLTFGTIGSLHGRFKGIQHALPALELARKSLPNFEYRILGGGEQTPWKQLVKRHGLEDQVYFDGTLPSGDSVMNWLDSIDIYLHPSLREGLPRAVVEAMSRGCTVIASDVAGTPELLPPNVLHEPGDVRKLSKLIIANSDRNAMYRSADINWRNSLKYSSESLQAKRDMFWTSFADHAQRQKATPSGPTER